MNWESLKENLKIALMLCSLFLAVAIPVTIAALQIWSPEVTVTVSEYTLTITDPPDGTTLDTFTFTGFLTLDGSPVEGETVTLYIDGVATTDTDITASDGSYSITWTPTASGTFTFKTYVEIP